MAVMADTAAERNERTRDDAAVSVRVVRGLASVAALWRALEENCLVTPYQRYDWMTMYLDACGIAPDSVAIAMIEAEGEPVAAIPLLITRRLGIVLGRLPGSDIANTDWLMIDPDRRHLIDMETVLDALGAIRAIVGRLDAVAFYNQPESWQGLSNPLLALPHQPAPDPFFLGGIADDVRKRRPPARRLRNIQRGRRRLEESYGPIILKRAKTAEQVQVFHTAFLEQRTARFKEQGIHNIFAEKRFTDFFRRAALASLERKSPTLCLHALYTGDEIAAVSIGAFSGTHYSQYIHSITDGPAARASLMSILIQELLDELEAAGVRTFDMGLGEFRYKNDWTERQPVYDSAIGFTPAGRLAARAMLARRSLKRTMKQNPTLWTVTKALRGYVTYLRRMAGAVGGRPPGG